jgi:hypothetical protein
VIDAKNRVFPHNPSIPAGGNAQERTFERSTAKSLFQISRCAERTKTPQNPQVLRDSAG